MRTSVSRSVLPLFLSAAVANTAHATYLEADGRLRVEGASWKDTRVYVVPAFGKPYELELKDTRFTIPLPLQEEYLLSFEHPDCPTKQIVINAHVPEFMSAQGFDFPFLVTLSYLPEEDRFQYEGPVGFVRYSPPTADFIYSTQYNIIRPRKMLERLDDLRQAPAAPLAPAPILTASGAAGKRSAAGPKGEEVMLERAQLTEISAPPPLPPVVREELDRLAVRPPERLGRKLAYEPVRMNDVTSIGSPIVHVERSAPHAVAVEKKTIAPPTARPVRVVSVSTPQLGTACDEEEALVEPRRVTYIKRISQDGICTELRKVVHAYGGVFFFRNGVSITQRDHEQAIGAHSVEPMSASN